MTEAQFELLLAATREQHNELRAIHEAATHPFPRRPGELLRGRITNRCKAA
jgi:hypothetical protein